MGSPHTEAHASCLRSYFTVMPNEIDAEGIVTCKFFQASGFHLSKQDTDSEIRGSSESSVSTGASLPGGGKSK